VSTSRSDTESGSIASGARLRAAFLLLVVPFAPALLTGWLHPRRPDWIALRSEAAAPAPGRLELEQVRAAYPNALWIDARSESDFSAGHVPEAVLLNEEDWDKGFANFIEKWDGERPLIVYCGGERCHASESVARRLRRELGFENVHVLHGGWSAWQAASAGGAAR
jgi:rhodanese-related sulfurtransferase